jgi:hypothetical protein
MRSTALAVMLLSTVLSGCAALNSIKRDTTIPAIPADKSKAKGLVVSVDAKQRHLIIVPEIEVIDGKAVNTAWRFCAEAAPDAFSAYAASGGAKGNKDGGELSFSSAETASSIERTQTINLLRESFYRTCERYASGAISKEQFIIQAARDQRSMVAVLAIEQLTRVARPPAIIISGPATSASIRDGEAAAKMVEEFRKTAETASGNLTSARASFDAADKTGKCKDSDTPPTGDGDDADAMRAEHAKCLEAKLKFTIADADNTLAQDRLTKSLDIAALAVNSLSAQNLAGQQSTGAGGGPISDAAILAVSAAVTEIAKAPGVDEPLMFCIAHFTANPLYSKETLVDLNTACISILQARANTDNTIRNQSSSNAPKSR